jgi:tRNA (guanine-N7-)-methyltransferase
MDKPVTKIRSYITRAGRISPAQKRALEELLPKYGCMAEEGVSLPLDRWFPDRTSLILEIGFGMGEATAEIAKARPDSSFIAVEVHKPGIGRLLNQIEREELHNIRVVEGDAEIVVNSMLPAGSLSGVHIFFADPWPKKKHHKRRLIQATFLEALCLRLVPGGYIYAVTDWEDYAQWIIEESGKVISLRNPGRGFSAPAAWRPRTRFEKKGLDKQHSIREIWLEKV